MQRWKYSNESFCPPTVAGLATSGGLSNGLPPPPQPPSASVAASRAASASARCIGGVMASGSRCRSSSRSPCSRRSPGQHGGGLGGRAGRMGHGRGPGEQVVLRRVAGVGDHRQGHVEVALGAAGEDEAAARDPGRRGRASGQDGRRRSAPAAPAARGLEGRLASAWRPSARRRRTGCCSTGRRGPSTRRADVARRVEQLGVVGRVAGGAGCAVRASAPAFRVSPNRISVRRLLRARPVALPAMVSTSAGRARPSARRPEPGHRLAGGRVDQRVAEQQFLVRHQAAGAGDRGPQVELGRVGVAARAGVGAAVARPQRLDAAGS